MHLAKLYFHTLWEMSAAASSIPLSWSWTNKRQLLSSVLLNVSVSLWFLTQLNELEKDPCDAHVIPVLLGRKWMPLFYFYLHCWHRGRLLQRCFTNGNPESHSTVLLRCICSTTLVSRFKQSYMSGSITIWFAHTQNGDVFCLALHIMWSEKAAVKVALSFSFVFRWRLTQLHRRRKNKWRLFLFGFQSRGDGRPHEIQHVLIISGRGTRYDGTADLVTDGAFRCPTGCLLAGHTLQEKHCFSSAASSDVLTNHLLRVLPCANITDAVLGRTVEFDINIWEKGT